LSRPQLQVANRVHPPAVGAVDKILAGRRGPNGALAQQLGTPHRRDGRDLPEHQSQHHPHPRRDEQGAYDTVERNTGRFRRRQLGVPSQRADHENGREQNRNGEHEKHLLRKVEHIRQRHCGRLELAAHEGAHLVREIDHHHEDRKSEERDQKDAQPLAEHVAIERPDCGLGIADCGL
jgi:hypothetical protein